MTKGLQVWALFKEELIFDNSYRFILSQHLNHKAYPDCFSKYFTVTIEVILSILANRIGCIESTSINDDVDKEM